MLTEPIVKGKMSIGGVIIDVNANRNTLTDCTIQQSSRKGRRREAPVGLDELNVETWSVYREEIAFEKTP